MSEMIERVAEAIYDSTPQWGALGGKTEEIKAEYRRMAVAAIEAMREPTREMVKAVYEPNIDYPRERCYEVMIDEALRPIGDDSMLAASEFRDRRIPTK